MLSGAVGREIDRREKQEVAFKLLNLLNRTTLWFQSNA
jgi:hypothetical protein